MNKYQKIAAKIAKNDMKKELYTRDPYVFSFNIHRNMAMIIMKNKKMNIKRALEFKAYTKKLDY